MYAGNAGPAVLRKGWQSEGSRRAAARRAAQQPRSGAAGCARKIAFTDAAQLHVLHDDRRAKWNSRNAAATISHQHLDQLPRPWCQVVVPVMHAWRRVSSSQPHQTVIARATGLIESREPTDTILVPAPQPRYGAAGVCRAPMSRLGLQSAWPHRRRGRLFPALVLQIRTGRPHGQIAGWCGARRRANRQHRCRE